MSFKPTPEQILDYHLGKCEPMLSRQISSYLGENTDAREELSDWREIENIFQSATLPSPSEDILQKVRAMAAQQAARQRVGNWFESALSIFSPGRRMAVALTLAGVVGLMFFFTQTPTSNQSPSNNAAFHGATKVELEPVKVTATDDAHEKLYQSAVQAYRDGKFEDANRLFGDVMIKSPEFGKRRELYGYWIESLKKAGQFDLAEKKREQLEQLK